ncbi:MAG: pilus assembly protein [Rhodobacteraceae bacterium]|nr:pilus assembly protein [Paracoccaceae bacterium]
MKHLLKKLRKDERGHASIEFVIMFPLFFWILVSAIDIGMVTMRSALLERALDIVVRDIRLSTGTAPDHDKIRDAICDTTNVVQDCKQNLMLEMQVVDMRSWTDLPHKTSCTNQAEEAQPVTTFQNGLDNEMMVLRACAKITPIFGDKGIGPYLNKDSNGDVPIVALSAFVQEPR